MKPRVARMGVFLVMAASETQQAALFGFHAAKIRYDAHDSDDDAPAVFVPLAESLWWAMTLDESLEKTDGEWYATARSGNVLGQQVRGARFARNRVNHQLALPVRRIDGAMYPRAYPMRFFEFVWLDLAELPEGWPDKEGEEMYAHALAGKPARETLRACAGWFATLQNEPRSSLAGEVPPDLIRPSSGL